MKIRNVFGVFAGNPAGRDKGLRAGVGVLRNGEEALAVGHGLRVPRDSDRP